MFTNDPPLQPLRIPQGWRISYNDFRELDPSEEAARAQYLTRICYRPIATSPTCLSTWAGYPTATPMAASW